MMKVKSTLLIFGLSILGLTGRGMAVPAPQRLQLSPCQSPGLADARCGTYEVYENRTTKTGRKIPLRVVVLPALGAGRLPDPFVYFAGGPGASAVQEGLFRAHALKN